MTEIMRLAYVLSSRFAVVQTLFAFFVALALLLAPISLSMCHLMYYMTPNDFPL